MSGLACSIRLKLEKNQNRDEKKSSGYGCDENAEKYIEASGREKNDLL